MIFTKVEISKIVTKVKQEKQDEKLQNYNL